MPIYLQHGNLIDYVPPTDTSTEDVVFMGGLVGIPQAFIQAGELGALSVDGVYMFNKKEGVSVNLGEVVKYCGTTKLAQDSNADLTLGVAVADAEADDFGVKVKINSVLPTDGGGGGGGEVVIDTTRGLSETSSGVGINIGTGLSFGSGGALIATGGGGGGDGIQNRATGIVSLSILGEATTSDYSISVGSGANASSYRSIALGACSYAGCSSSIAIGAYTKASGSLSTALGNDVQVHDDSVASIGAFSDSLRTQLYVIAEGSPLSNQYLNGKAGLAYAVWGDSEIYTNGKVKEGKIIALEDLFTNGTDFVPSTEEGGGDCCCLCC